MYVYAPAPEIIAPAMVVVWLWTLFNFF